MARQELLKNASVFGDDLAAEVAELLACIAPYADHMHNYARAVAAGAASCADSFEQLYERLRVMWEDVDASNRYDFLALKMNAKVVKNAERHFRLMVEQGPASWNARVDHFYNVVAHLLEYHGPPSRAVVWAHNTHIGDARFTSMGAGGQRNIGQIARERHQADDVVAVGFGTYRGTVQAGRAWGAPMETMQVPDGRPDSVEALMLQVEMPSALFIFTEAENLSPLMEVRGHRAIGVVYQPDRERLGNYVPTILPRRYDAFIFFEETRALTPVQ